MICVAIDGPAGSGKSTVSKMVAKRMGYISVDTGALYRTIAYYLKTNGIDYKSPEEIKKALKGINLEVYSSGGEFIVVLNGKNISSEIRCDEIAFISSEVSKFLVVRDYLLELQRDLARKNNVVMDGRDIGTVVVPDAKVKIYLTASLEVRAMRRYYQMRRALAYEKILSDLAARDHEDINRENSPLRRADDAIFFDNSNYTLEETVEKICSIIAEKTKDE